MHTETSQNGWKYAVACYVMWGLFPIYWYPLNHSAMPAEQILAHRIVWSAVFALILLWVFVKPSLCLPRSGSLNCWVRSRCRLLIGLNWLVYLWAIINHRVLDASLGYFINPLVNVFWADWCLKKNSISRKCWRCCWLWAAFCGWRFPWGRFHGWHCCWRAVLPLMV